jgi:hypothetical protein
MTMSHIEERPWQPMSSAPKNATDVEVQTPAGEVLVAHWACDLSGEDQPPYRGWFKKVMGLGGRVLYCAGIDEPKAWRPLQEEQSTT